MTQAAHSQAFLIISLVLMYIPWPKLLTVHRGFFFFNILLF